MAANPNVPILMQKYGVSSLYNADDPLNPLYAQLVALYTPNMRMPFPAASQRGVSSFIEACLRSGGLQYFKKAPGDCPAQTNLQLGPQGKIALGVGAASSTLGTAAALSGGGAIAGVSIASVASGVGLIALPFTIWAAFNAAHARAVATEQETLCAVTSGFNGGAAQIIAASKSADPKQVQQAFTNLANQAMQLAKTVAGSPCGGGFGGGQYNAGCYFLAAIQALRDLFIQLYVNNVAAQAASIGNSPQVAAVGSASVPGTAVAIGGGVVAAKFLGLF